MPPTPSAELQKRHPNVNPFILAKWERVFNAFFDRNMGGDVDWTDFYLVSRKVRDIYGADSVQMTYAKSSMKSLWEGLLAIADQNTDKVISVDEWVSVLEKCDPKTEPKWFNDYLTYLFKLFDVSADDKLDLAEYTDGMNTYGFSDKDAHKAFHKFALDKKTGKPAKDIDWFQWRDYWQQYFYSDDPKAIGNNLFGVLD